MPTHNSQSTPEHGNSGNGGMDGALGTLTARHPHHPPVQPPRTGTKLGIFAVILAVGLAVGFFIVQHHKKTERDALEQQTISDSSAAPSVDVVAVKYASATQSIPLPGTTHGWYETTIYARVNGYVSDWKADIGDKVTKGQVLATIETPDLDQQLVAAQEKLQVSEAEVKVAEAASDFAKSTYNRWRESPKGVVSDQEREEKKSEYETSDARLNAAQSQVNADKANVAQLTDLQSFKQVTAPFDGIITSRRIDIGDLVTAGSTSNTTSLYSLAQADKLRVFVDVPQRIAAKMQPGVTATAVSNEFPDQQFQGTIARTSRAIDPASRTLRVEVDIDNPKLVLMPGMYAEVTFHLEHSGLLEIPASALLFRSSGPQVAVVSSDGTVKFHDVTIGVDQGSFVEIASGISANDKVALNISSQIADGQHVDSTEIDKTADASSSHNSNAGGVVTADADAEKH